MNTGETAANGIDDDGNGYVDDIDGYDFLRNDPSPQDNTVGHGSHVAGIAAAAADNSIGGAGVCPACKLMILRAGDDGGFPLDATLEAIVYAVENGADIINMSLGGPVWSKLLRKALASAGDSGVLVVAAAGNSDRDNDQLYYLPGGDPFAPDVSREPRPAQHHFCSGEPQRPRSVRIPHRDVTLLEAAQSAASRTGATHPWTLPLLG